MPYIARDRRKRLIKGVDEIADAIMALALEDADEVEACAKPNPGDVNFVISKLLHYLYTFEGKSYSNINEVIGILECAKQEFYRRQAAPYEDKKKDISGDVF